MTVQATFAATLVDEWARHGVAHAVVCPGSRSTPLALALAADGRIRVHVVLDERSGGFVALGIALATGVPAVVLTTSGTAAVELHPAVVEAHHSGVPLLAVTADRPPELRDVGAAQTVDQARLFGGATRWYCDPGVADGLPRHAWRSIASRAVVEAATGPVHLNLPLRDPLVGEPGPLPPGRPSGGPWHRRAVGASAIDPDDLGPLAAARRGVIVAGRGAGDPEAVHALAARAGWPALADPLSGCRLPVDATVAAFDALLRVPSFAGAHRPDVVLRLGQPPASKVLAQWLAGLDAPQVQVGPSGRWIDPDRNAALVLDADPTAVCRAVDDIDPDPAWLAAWRAGEAAAQAAIDGWLGDRPPGAAPTEPGVARGVVDALPDGTRLVVSSSMPVRDVEWYARPRNGVEVLANRGANGIDGVVSSALGVAAAGGPVAALVGDLAFLHDAGGLLGASARGVDCTFVVVDNGGGGIFSFLPQARALPGERFERLFGTPHDVDLAALAAVHHVPAVGAATDAEATAAVQSAVASGGVRMVLVHTDRSANVTHHDELHAAVARAIAGATGRS